MAIKLDLLKAYDRVDWRFLSQILSDFRFPESCIKLILYYVNNSSLLIVWNGCRLTPFKPQWGLSQDDLLSLYVFVLCVGRLSLLIEDSMNKNECKFMKVAKSGLTVSHIHFTDDVMLFSNASVP